MDKSFVRVSNNGLNGVGKTCTMAQLAVGIAIEYGDRAPIHVFDSSDRWRAWKRHIFDVEKIPLVITYGESIAVLQKAVDKAAHESCSVFVGDDLTIPWMEGVRAFSGSNGNLTFSQRQQLMNEWGRFVHLFKHGPFHSLACGRLGYQWENVEDEEGNEVLHQGDSKFNAGGGDNFGYDADLEVEMRRRKRRVLGFFRGKTLMEHICDIVKDAHGILNGQQFAFTDWDGPYQRGMYKAVLDQFRPHIEFVMSLPRPPFDDQTSKSLQVSGKTEWAKDQSTRKGLLEELEGNLTFCFGSNQSTQGKMFRSLTLEFLNGHISWSRMEEETPTEKLRDHVLIVKAMRKRIESKEMPTDHNSLLGLCDLARRDVFSPGHGRTLLEVMGIESINRLKQSKRGPQSVVALMDQPLDDEVAGA